MKQIIKHEMVLQEFTIQAINRVVTMSVKVHMQVKYVVIFIMALVPTRYCGCFFGSLH